MPLRTCLPIGCLVAVSFDAPMVVALRAGTALKIKATTDSGAAAPFSVSLLGFATTSTAWQRCHAERNSR